jgi:hypothetical protein
MNMKIVVPWVAFGLPLAAIVIAWVGLLLKWGAQERKVPKILAFVLATAAPLFGCGTLIYVQTGAQFARYDTRGETWGVVLSLSGILSSVVSSRHPTWYSTVALLVSIWTALVFCLSAVTG